MLIFNVLSKYLLKNATKRLQQTFATGNKKGLFSQAPNQHKVDYIMNRFNFKGEFFSLDNLAKIANNAITTTKLLAVKPNRHTLAFLLSVILTNNSQRYSLNPSIFGRVSVYNGLIGVNTKPKGNSPSRLVTVVESRYPICGNKTLTKLLGGYHA